MQIRSSPFVRVQNRKHIILDMPLWMPTAALLDVARESIMPTRTERLAHFLRLFAGYKYIHISPSSLAMSKNTLPVPLLCSCRSHVRTAAFQSFIGWLPTFQPLDS